ncbi:hypothetical protein [Promicromonospora sp. NPDC050880]|uniref:hypothetical protein n=1 Tax=Promicromonospora sp. NPDC050880 TaxID=3364406 RepID=UPI00379C66AC
MSATHNYLARRAGLVRTQAAATANDIARLQRQHENQLAELAEVEAALAAVDALAEEPDQTDDDVVAAEIDAAFAEHDDEETDRG